MSSEAFIKKPRDWVAKVVQDLGERMGTNIDTVYKRKPSELKETTISYQVGELEAVNEFSCDGRHKHDIELRFLVEVPTSINDFDLEAMDASARIEREILNMNESVSPDTETARVVSNLPSQFSPVLGVFARTVTIRQQIMMGPVEEEYGKLAGWELSHGDSETNPGA
ncbi:hypothetical protein L3Q72_06685 [Vibrio sp. JC009]|uniref:hypothetical protein n=1 Tax=Vibrio sp. JC009 TaxID=2912314 RepID=UPI0023AF769B|nr:hypothetical protein [Vibrio sp. JC009]WED23074.1 hypothetical protein L3Q72_06685 [Vibrio sp. JC009]